MMVSVLFVLSAAACGLAWALAAGDKRHLPIAVLLTTGLSADVLRYALVAGVLRAAREASGGGPLTGLPALAAHVDGGLFLAWPCALGAVALVVFERPRGLAGVMVAAYVAAGFALALMYPWARGPTLARVYAAANLSGLGVAVGAAATWYLRTEPAGDQPNSAQSSLLLILPLELAALLGAWRAGIYDAWGLSRVVYLVMFSMLVLAQGGWLWRSRHS